MSLQKQFAAIQLAGISILIIAAVFLFIDPIAQDPHYHCFAHEQTIGSIPNFWNVVSNIGFIISGFWGFVVIKSIKNNHQMLYALFVGMILTGLGSAYYHYHPNNTTLVWDRLPMTLVFTAFFAQIYAWYFNVKTAIFVWLGSLFVGMFSVWYWQETELLGCGDLRLYAVVQFLPIVLIAIICIQYRKENVWIHKPLCWIFVCYLLAKVLEYFDVEIFQTCMVVSGHPIKHVAASLATACMVWMVKKYVSIK